MSGSKRFISILNFATMLLSIPVLTTGFWLASKHHTECTRFLETPVVFIGAFMLLLSMAGFVGSCWTLRWLLWIYLFVMFLLILLLLSFTTFALVVTSNEAAVPQDMTLNATTFNQYQLSLYSGWLTDRVQNVHNWNKIKSCLAAAEVCASNAMERPSFFPQFIYRHLNPLQLGCCKPPALCQYTYINSSFWDNPENSSASPDCHSWSNDPMQLCFECSTCKAGLLANLQRDWKNVAFVNIIVVAFMVLVYAVGCCVFQNAKRHRRRYLGMLRKRSHDTPTLSDPALKVVDERAL